ncbi:DNA-formamidopyrimidine glycosylase [Lactobacillus sp. S2-2]|uniref:DNA-formamidopyrimidine glycosylase n=1 Tax=Lactobacillus sp. S2-2 TaxID=2692917 RepID=UPI001F017724|nr:DNA-formamidopyrimidine glycosylase [Lactobacillus sp. S2-2]MCF6515153.1 DNA-formamidopyrimidine glycosylase [Lactobacillus sp. S2-2]
MPELPEVETVRRGLTQLVEGSKIISANAYYDKMLNISINDFENTLKDKTIEKIDRRGKYLLFRLSDNYTIVSHLRMEGKYDVQPDNSPLDKHTYVVFHLNNDRELRYNDTRKFGKMSLVKTGDEYQLSGLKSIGPEPTYDTLKFEYLKQRLMKGKRKLKAFLLDQDNVAGLGNIYADEVLWMSKINPEQITNTLSDNEIKALRENIIKEIDAATKGHGTTVHSYSNAFGEAGQFQNNLHAYGMKDKPCSRCGTNFEKIKVAQRGTTFCPKCQMMHGDQSE